MKTIYLGTDHRGFQLKTKVKSQHLKVNLEDLGVKNTQPADYPLIAKRVAKAVVANPDSLGILICGSGQGMCVAANKIKGARAGIGINPEAVKSGREDDHLNILCLSAGFVDQAENLAMVKAFLNATPKTDQRYLRRLSQIKTMENES